MIPPHPKPGQGGGRGRGYGGDGDRGECAIGGVKLVDIGNAMALDHVAQYYDTFDVQTPTYRAPEVLFGVPFGPAIDLWSLGCILAELLSGKPLFKTPQGKPHELLFAMINLLGIPPKGLFKAGRFYEPLDYHFGRAVSQHPEIARLIPKTGEQRRGKLAKVVLGGGGLSQHPDAGNLVDFIQRLLCYDPEARMGPREAFCHPFITRVFSLVYYLLPPPQTLQKEQQQQKLEEKRGISIKSTAASPPTATRSIAVSPSPHLKSSSSSLRNCSKDGSDERPGDITTTASERKGKEEERAPESSKLGSNGDYDEVAAQAMVSGAGRNNDRVVDLSGEGRHHSYA